MGIDFRRQKVSSASERMAFYIGGPMRDYRSIQSCPSTCRLWTRMLSSGWMGRTRIYSPSASRTKSNQCDVIKSKTTRTTDIRFHGSWTATIVGDERAFYRSERTYSEHLQMITNGSDENAARFQIYPHHTARNTVSDDGAHCGAAISTFKAFIGLGIGR